MKNNNIKTTTRCLTHHCNRCGYDLTEKYGLIGWLIPFGVMFIPILLLTVVTNIQKKQIEIEIESRKPECYQKRYMLDSETGIHEKYQVKKIDCPR